MELDGIDWKGVFWGDRNVIYHNRDTSYTNVYIYENSLNCILMIYGFHSIYI